MLHTKAWKPDLCVVAGIVNIIFCEYFSLQIDLQLTEDWS